MEQNLSLSKFEVSNPSSYRRLVGRLIYLTITRPDLANVVHVLIQFMDKPRVPHLQVVHHVLRYLKQTSGQGISFPSESLIQLNAFCDTDWGKCHNTHRSVTGYCILLDKSLTHGKQRSNRLYQGPVLRLNIVRWPQCVVK